MTRHLFYHNNHVVKCSKRDCGNYVLALHGHRMNSDGNRRQTLICLLCGAQFRCCAKKTNLGIDMKRKRELVLYIAGLRKRIKQAENKLYEKPAIAHSELEKEIEVEITE